MVQSPTTNSSADSSPGSTMSEANMDLGGMDQHMYFESALKQIPVGGTKDKRHRSKHSKRTKKKTLRKDTVLTRSNRSVVSASTSRTESSEISDGGEISIKRICVSDDQSNDAFPDMGRLSLSDGLDECCSKNAPSAKDVESLKEKLASTEEEEQDLVVRKLHAEIERNELYLKVSLAESEKRRNRLAAHKAKLDGGRPDHLLGDD